MLVGIGFDIHRHSQEDTLYLGGLKIDGPGIIPITTLSKSIWSGIMPSNYF